MLPNLAVVPEFTPTAICRLRGPGTGQDRSNLAGTFIKKKLYLESFHQEKFFQHHFCPIFATALGGWGLALRASVEEDSHRTRGVRTGVSTTCA